MMVKGENMEIENIEARKYLIELHEMTGGDETAQVSMYDVGAALGLDRSAAGALAEDLIVEGLVELRNLAGGISITQEGLELLNAGDNRSGGETPLLGNSPSLGDDKKEAVGLIVEELQSELSSKQLPYEIIEKIVIDIKTLQVQLLSPSPTTAIVREILRSLAQSANDGGLQKSAGKINTMIES